MGVFHVGWMIAHNDYFHVNVPHGKIMIDRDFKKYFFHLPFFTPFRDLFQISLLKLSEIKRIS